MVHKITVHLFQLYVFLVANCYIWINLGAFYVHLSKIMVNCDNEYGCA